MLNNNTQKTHILINILTVTKNSDLLLQGTIENIRKIKELYSNLFNIKYIIVDGESTDKTNDLVKKNADIVDLFLSEPDTGIYDAMNKAWNLANKESYIIFLGSGDKLLSLPHIDMFDGKSVIIGNVDLGNNKKFNSTAYWMLKISNTIHHQSMLTPKFLHPTPPFDKKYRVYADFDFNQRLFKKKASFLKCNLFLGYAEPGGISAKIDSLEMALICRKNFGVFYSFLSLIYTSAIKSARVIRHKINHGKL